MCAPRRLEFAAASRMLAVAAVVGCSAPALTALPENPCDLLSVEELAAATGVKISGANRVLGQRESFEAARSGQEPRPGSICRYETPSEFGSIAVIFRDRRGPLGSRSEPPNCGTHWSAAASEDGRVRVSGGTASVQISSYGFRCRWAAGRASQTQRAE
jgi:hypothetical protein